MIVICNNGLSFLQNGLAPIHLAAQEDKVNVAEVLVKFGSEIDPQTKVRYIFTILRFIVWGGTRMFSVQSRKKF